MTRIVNPGTAMGYTRKGSPIHARMFCEISYTDGKLSITGVVGPTRGGNAHGGFGQIVGTEVLDFTPGWDAELLARFYEVWHRWHLNDMRAGCEHQRAAGWDKRPINPDKPLNAYGEHVKGHTTWNMLTWIKRSEHPEGLLCEPCPECGYKYGTAWLSEPVPDDVLAFLESLPETTVTPAWV